MTRSVQILGLLTSVMLLGPERPAAVGRARCCGRK